jgi:hypothetical protein
MAVGAIFLAAGKGAPLSFLARDGAEILFFAPLILLLIALAFLAPHHGMRWFRKIENAFARLSRHRTLAVATIAAAALLIVMMLSGVAGLPIPKVDDEFSYLLAADTFAHGRLTNPTHPMWTHFETFHTIQQPTYASRYPPGQGLILALGQILGHPVVGVWISTAFACAAICWMLMGWLPARWALLGAILAILHPEILFWSQRYWGGSLTLAGGALALCGFRRLTQSIGAEGRHLRSKDAALMALGMSILILCRPYEGGVLILILLAILIAATVRKAKSTRAMLARAGLPIAAGLIVTLAWMSYYNWRVTRDPFRMPQQVYVASYNAAPVFLWQRQPPTPEYRNNQMRDFHTGWELRPYLKQRTSFAGLLTGVLERLLRLLRSTFRLWPLLVAFAAIPWALKNGWTKLALSIWAVFTLALLQVTWTFFHYAAPAFALFFIIAVQSLRHLRLWHWRGKPVGLFLARGCVILSALSLPLTAWSVAQQNRYARRNNMIARLEHEGGKHLVVVRYDPADDNLVEWVYNAADIDDAQIVWARELDAAQNRELLNYFKDRRVWLLQVSRRSTHLAPYPSTGNL